MQIKHRQEAEKCLSRPVAQFTVSHKNSSNHNRFSKFLYGWECWIFNKHILFPMSHHILSMHVASLCRELKIEICCKLQKYNLKILSYMTKSSNVSCHVAAWILIDYWTGKHKPHVFNSKAHIRTKCTSSLAIAERPCYRVGQFWLKVEDDILQTI